MDPWLGTDWAAHWRRLVEARAAAAGRRPDYWERRAAHYGSWITPAPDPLLQVLEPWLRPRRTAIDVGAGTGRHIRELTRRLDWVTAVEPAATMRERIPGADNLTLIGSRWEDAEPAPADLVLCVHVLYPIAEPVPFIEKLEASARERVFVVLRDAQDPHPAKRLTRPRLPREPQLGDCFALLRQAGVTPDLTMYREPNAYRYPSLEAAVEDSRLRVGGGWEEATGRGWLEANLEPEDGGGLRWDAGELPIGVLNWTPRRSRS